VFSWVGYEMISSFLAICVAAVYSKIEPEPQVRWMEYLID
jgi:hypothetical protein